MIDPLIQYINETVRLGKPYTPEGFEQWKKEKASKAVTKEASKNNNDKE